MKQRILWFVLILLLLTGCAREKGNGGTPITICVEEGYGFSVEENPISLFPGEDAQFRLRTQRGVSVTGADYPGDYQLSREKGVTTLSLKAVTFPARIHLTVSSRYCTITYEPNGGLGATTQMSYSLNNHSRPNTSNGAELFVRDGYTLISWNTAPDGSGLSIGLGSRVSVPQYDLTLYAQWAEWSSSELFDVTDGTITGYHGTERVIVIPERLEGQTVTALGPESFQGCSAEAVILPPTIRTVADGAFRSSSLSEVTLFDNIMSIPDEAFTDCPRLQTLRINAREAPYGYLSAKESCYADKIDLLINAQGRRKLVCYGGCSMWYNLDGSQFQQAFGDQYQIINAALNGTVNSAVQMQILTHFLEPGDLFFHTPELSSRQQLLLNTDMGEHDTRLWCGLENNYDLFALVDLREVEGVFGSLTHYLSTKKQQASYDQVFMDDHQVFLDRWGCVPIARTSTQMPLADTVSLNPDLIDPHAMDRLAQAYARMREKGVSVLLSYACVNLDAVPEAQRNNVALMDRLFREAVEGMSGPVLVSSLQEYLYHNTDCFDTNYHLLFPQAQENTCRWVRDLTAYAANGEFQEAVP